MGWKTNLYRASVAAGLGAGLLCLAPPDARAENYKDEKLGFSLSTPKRWKRMPVAVDEQWIVAKFQSEREYEAADPKLGFYTMHTPWMDVVVIPRAVVERGGASVERTEKGVKVNRAAPWRDLKEYLDKTLQSQWDSGGFFFSKEEQAEVNGMKVIQYEITMDKNVDHPKRIWGWQFETEDALWGLVAESLVRHEDKLRPDIESAFRTFRTFARTGSLPKAEVTGEEITIDDDSSGSTQEELERRRREAVTRRLERVTENLGDGWTTKESKHFVAVSNADAKFTSETLDHAERLREWLDENLDFVGTGYAGRVILRICKNREEYEAFQKTAKWSRERVEVTTYEDRDGWFMGARESLNRGIFDIWLRDRNPRLAWSLPRWIDQGLASVIACAEPKGRKMEFRPSTWDRVKIMELRRQDKLLNAKTFFVMTGDDLFRDYENMQQAEVFVRFLLVGGAQKSKYKRVLADYVKALVFLLDEEPEPAKAAPGEEPKSEEEESAAFQARQKAWKDRERAVLDELLGKAFRGWSDKDWDKFNATYWKELE